MVKIPEGTPTDLVIRYREQGYDDDTIVQGLQQQGWTPQQVSDAVTQANQKKEAVAAPKQGMEKKESDDDEAMVESVVEEKWNELKKQIAPLNEWKDKTDAKIVSMEQQIKMLKESFDKLHEGVLGKITEYDTNLKDVGSSVKAMDKVFKNILPTLTENVNKLSKLSGRRQ